MRNIACVFKKHLQKGYSRIQSNTTLCDKFVSDLGQVGAWLSLGTLVFSTNKTDRHDITEIFFKVALNTINP
jgi:hypothetical protein